MSRAPLRASFAVLLTCTFVLGGVTLLPSSAEARRTRFKITTLKVNLSGRYNSRYNRYRVKRSARKNINKLKRCFYGVAKRKKLDGILYLSARFNSQGEVVSRTFQTTVSDRAAEACLKGGIKFWTLPRRAAGRINAEIKVRAR